MIKMLLKIFHEADQSCKDVSRMFYGGKGVIGEAGEGKIDILTLTREFQRFVFEKEPKNYKREIRSFAKANDIYCIDNCLGISRVHEDGTFDGFLESHLYIYRSVTKFPSNRPVYIYIGEYQIDVRKKEDTYSLSRVSLGGIEKCCQLYSDFIREPHISHEERFMIMTNLLNIDGGRKRFLSIIEKKGYDRDKWRFYVKYAKDHRYRPQSCEGICPYADTCEHKANIVLTLKSRDSIIKTEEETEYYSIEEVYDNLCNNLREAIEQRHEGIYLIPAQTAIGKTEAYCNMIRLYKDQRFIVAVPTNQLKREVEARLKEQGIFDILVTPSLDEAGVPKELEEEIQWLYQLGLGRKVTEALRHFIKKNKDSQEPEKIGAVSWCREYLRTEEELPKRRVVVTTHAKLVTLSREVIKNYQVIIDEDILSTFFKNIREVSIQAVRQVLKMEALPVLLEERLRQIMNTADGSYERFQNSMNYGYISREELETAGISEDINGISIASVFQKEEDIVHYFCPQTMQRGKYIILSATIEETLYRQYFQGWQIKAYGYLRAIYKGELVQLTAYSMSRYCIQEHKKELLKFKEQFYSNYEVITFMQYEDTFLSCGLHFGNTEGVDRLKGRNIIIIGTPHQNEFVYKLLGEHLGIKVNGDTLSVRRLKWGGYEFSFMAYKGKDLQALQIYFIRRELEQCIGRARLLREDCKVVVLSNFPCEQAELVQKDYLKEKAKDSNVCSPDVAGNI